MDDIFIFIFMVYENFFTSTMVSLMATTLSPKSEFANRLIDIYGTLSKSHQRIADFVLSRPLDVIAMSIEGVAQASGSSTATITRFVRAVGYSSFSEFKEKIVSDYQYRDSDKRNFSENLDSADEQSVLHTLLGDNVHNIQEAISNIDIETSNRFLSAIIRAKRIIILGTGASHYAAAYLEEGLGLYTEKSVSNILLRGANQYSSNFVRTLSQEDLVIAISMPRYSQSTVDLCGIAKSKGAKILVITDNTTSPLTPLADIILYSPAKSRLLPNSPAAIFALADAIVGAIAEQRPDIVSNTHETLPHDMYL